MEGFTFYKSFYETLKKIRKKQDRALAMLAVAEFMFDDEEPKDLSEVGEIAFESFRHILQKAKNMSGRGGRPSAKKIETNLDENENQFETNLKPNQNQFETNLDENETNSKTSYSYSYSSSYSKTKERKKETDINKTNNAGACVEDFSKMTDEELIAWGEGRSVCFDNAEDVDSLYAWNEEMEKRANETAKWSGKFVVRDGGLERLKSHAEIMTEFDVSNLYRETLKEFLRYCYANRHLVTNEKLTDIILRLDEACGDDDAAKCEYIRRAISGGYFDVRA